MRYDVSHRTLLPPEEMARKKIHLFCVVLPIALAVTADAWVVAGLQGLTAVALVADLVRLASCRIGRAFLRFAGPALKEEEHYHLTGATHLLLGALLSVMLFGRQVAALSILFLVLGDPAGVFVGQRLGRLRLFDKTVEGSAAFLTVSLLAALLFPGISLRAGIAGAICATAVEALPLGIDDNLLIPVASGAVVHYTMQLQ